MHYTPTVHDFYKRGLREELWYTTPSKQLSYPFHVTSLIQEKLCKYRIRYWNQLRKWFSSFIEFWQSIINITFTNFFFQATKYRLYAFYLHLASSLVRHMLNHPKFDLFPNIETHHVIALIAASVFYNDMAIERIDAFTQEIWGSKRWNMKLYCPRISIVLTMVGFPQNIPSGFANNTLLLRGSVRNYAGRAIIGIALGQTARHPIRPCTEFPFQQLPWHDGLFFFPGW